MADKSTPPADRHRHAHRQAPRDRRHVLLTVVGAVIVVAVAAVLVVYSWDRSDDAVADQPVTTPVASTPPASEPTPTPAPTTEETAPSPDVPGEFVAAMQQIGIPLDAQTGW